MRLPVLHVRSGTRLLRVPINRVQLALRAALAAGLSLALARQLGLEYPIYAMLAAVIVTDLTPTQTRQLGLRRLVATIVGAASGATLSSVLSPGPWSVGLSILLAMLICLVLQAQDAAKVAGYICGIVVLSHGTDSWTYAGLRFVETILGIGVAWLISLVPSLIRVDAAASPD